MTSLERALQHAERAEAAYASARESAGYNQGLNEARQNTEREMALMWAQVALAEQPRVHATVLPVDFGSPGNPDPARQPENGQETHDEGTLGKVRDALNLCLTSEEEITDAIRLMQNAGILFRERAKSPEEADCDAHKAAYFDSGYSAGLKDALDPSIVVKDWDPWYARPYVAVAAPSATKAVITLQEFDD